MFDSEESRENVCKNEIIKTRIIFADTKKKK